MEMHVVYFMNHYTSELRMYAYYADSYTPQHALDEARENGLSDDWFHFGTVTKVFDLVL